MSAKLKTSISWPQKSRAVHMSSWRRMVAEIDPYGVKTPVEPTIEGIQMTLIRPRGRRTVPPVELLLEKLAISTVGLVNSSWRR